MSSDWDNRNMTRRPQEEFPIDHSWRHKWRHALRGLKKGIRAEGNFFVHFFAGAIVLAAAIILRADRWQWSILALCVTSVLAAELFNTSLECLARAITLERHPEIGQALDIASAAVLVTCIGAAIVGAIVFLQLLGPMLGY